MKLARLATIIFLIMLSSCAPNCPGGIGGCACWDNNGNQVRCS